ncbi:MAG TPA: nuclear transport factor 2 family protein [Solirubrobacteraceae bacterium]|nr:nuclear transport factor 2 family protein [Solirubrobacteraceae bacterium]
MYRLQRATNEHDLDGLVGCFGPDYRNETPAHPERGFTGREQVRANWTQIFSAIPDVNCEVLRCAADGDTVWSEWEHRGTRPDGTHHLMRGVVIFGIEDGLAAWARFYLEPVQLNAGTVDQAVRQQVMPGGPS